MLSRIRKLFSNGNARNARNARNATLADVITSVKVFDVFAIREERGAFLTQQRNVRIGMVRARTMQEANQEAERLYGNGAYAECR